MKQFQYKIWWSPVGHENGSDIIFASSESEAKELAKKEMQLRSGAGAYGAKLLEGQA